MTRIVGLVLLFAIVLSIVGCQGGEVDAKAAEASYKGQEDKAKALAAKNGETPVKEEGQGN